MSHVENIYIFIGPPGAGKGSVSNLCVNSFGWTQISSGNLCRKNIAEQTKIGKEIDFIIKSGKLIDDELITRMIFEWFSEHKEKITGVILDGYPRTVAQAKALDEIVKSIFLSKKIYVVLFHLSDDKVVERLCSRFICQNKDCQAVYSGSSYSDLEPKQYGVCDICSSKLGRREDDSESSVRDRLKIYHKHEQQLISFYRHNGHNIIELDASRPLRDVFEKFVELIGINKK